MKKKIPVKVYEEIKPFTTLTGQENGEIVNEGGSTYLVTTI